MTEGGPTRRDLRDLRAGPGAAPVCGADPRRGTHVPGRESGRVPEGSGPAVLTFPAGRVTLARLNFVIPSPLLGGLRWRRERTPRVTAAYNEDHVRSLDWREHIRTRPGMYIGKLGDGSHFDDGIYVLLKEVLDNCVDEFMMGAGKRIDIEVDERSARVRDYGRGHPPRQARRVRGKINTGAKYDKGAFYRSVGLNGVGNKAVNALSTEFTVRVGPRGHDEAGRVLPGQAHQGGSPQAIDRQAGHLHRVHPDPEIFRTTGSATSTLRTGSGTTPSSTGASPSGSTARRSARTTGWPIFSPGRSTRRASTPSSTWWARRSSSPSPHTNQYGESYLSFVNGQYTTDGGTHQAAFREGALKAFREFFKKDYDPHDVRNGIVAAVLVRIHEPIFESQTKTKLGSTMVTPEGPSVRAWVVDFVRGRPRAVPPQTSRDRPARCTGRSCATRRSGKSSRASRSSPTSARRRPRSTTRS